MLAIQKLKMGEGEGESEPWRLEQSSVLNSLIGDAIVLMRFAKIFCFYELFRKPMYAKIIGFRYLRQLKAVKI